MVLYVRIRKLVVKYACVYICCILYCDSYSRLFCYKLKTNLKHWCNILPNDFKSCKICLVEIRDTIIDLSLKFIKES